MNESTQLITLENTPLMEREDIIPDKMREYYASLPEALKYSSEEELRKTKKIKLMDERLRSAFWRELQISLHTKKKIIAKRIFTGLCSEQHFYRIIATPERIAWITTPVIPYEARTDALLTLAVGRYEEILEMDIMVKKKRIVGKDEDGNAVYDIVDVVDPFSAKLLMEAIKNLEERVKGLSVQRQHVMHEKAECIEKTDVGALSMDEVNKKLDELNGKLGNNKDIIDVVPE